MNKNIILIVMLIATFLVAGEALKINQNHHMTKLLEHKFSRLLNFEHRSDDMGSGE